MIKLVITDLDGTFLDPDSRFDEVYYQKVRELMQKQQVAFAPCTGKQSERVEELFANVGSDDLWILGDSASRIKHNGQFVYESLLSNQTALVIIAKLRALHQDYGIIARTDQTAYIAADTPENCREKIRGSYTNVTEIKDYQEITDDFVKITLFDPYERAFEIRPQLAEFDDRAYIVASEAAWIDITNHQVHKGTTVAKLQEILGVTSAETMVFGDGYNDLELMTCGKFSFAMRNGFPETQAVARYICGSNAENAVLTTIEQILSLQD
ncbi:HAD-IIB family hydrolase [Candidatus Enterococcus leclercqii]|uniref:HAD-IIB family hydrolase n=1 Tax=Candidatus Enterococcus leclercqii TaxID=1857218 RepID=UPI00137A425C|nr:HAD family hydrolase [Enterococcus sp. CU9D]KAF1291111.1 hydrolase [Enterococcus sp. CU9D]